MQKKDKNAEKYDKRAKKRKNERERKNLVKKGKKIIKTIFLSLHLTNYMVEYKLRQDEF